MAGSSVKVTKIPILKKPVDIMVYKQKTRMQENVPNIQAYLVAWVRLKYAQHV